MCPLSSLYWTETTDHGHSTLMRWSLETKDIQPVLGTPTRHRRHNRSPCNCANLTPSKKFVVDHTRTEDTEIFVADNETGTIWAVDLQGCRCRQVVNNTGSGGQQADTHRMGRLPLTYSLLNTYVPKS